MCLELPTVSRAARGAVTAAQRRRSRSQQECQRSIEDLGRIARWDGMAREGLHAAKLLLRLARDRELQFVALRRRGVRAIGLVTSCALLSRRFSTPQGIASHAIAAEE